MKRFLFVALLGFSVTACGQQTHLPTKPVTPETTTVMDASLVSKEAHAGGYGDQRILFFFILAYLFAPAVL